MNEFTLGTVTDQDFWDYWDIKGVNISAVDGTWQYAMWQIINGVEPMFYLVSDGTDYSLIDGFEYLSGMVENPLKINGDYPTGTYTFTGTVQGVYCVSDLISISLEVYPCPVLP